MTRPAREAISDVLALRGITDEVRARSVLADWGDLVGPKIAARTRPQGVVDRVLVVEVASSAWLHELNLLRPQLLAGLLARVGEPRLFDDLKLQLAGRTRRDPGAAPRPRPRPRPARPPPARATGAARETILREVDRVEDAELRALIARIRIDHDK